MRCSTFIPHVKPEIQVGEDASLGSCMSTNLVGPGFGNRICWTIFVCDHVPLADPSDISQACPHSSPLSLPATESMGAMLETGTHLRVQMDQSSMQTSDQ